MRRRFDPEARCDRGAVAQRSPRAIAFAVVLVACAGGDARTHDDGLLTLGAFLTADNAVASFGYGDKVVQGYIFGAP